MIVLKNGKKIFPQELETLINESPYIEESFVYGKLQEDTGDVKISVKVVYSKENELLKSKKIEEIEDIINSEIKNVNTKIPRYKYIKEVKITDEPLIKTTTQKIKRHEEMKKI